MKLLALLSAASAFTIESTTRDHASGYYGNENLGTKFDEKGDKGRVV